MQGSLSSKASAACPAVLLNWSSTTLFLGGVLFHVYFQGSHLPCPLLGGPLLCPFLGGSSSMSTSRGSSSMPTSGGVLFHVHFWGGPLPCPLLGVLFHVHFWGVLFHVHFWGVPCDLSHNAFIYHYRTPQCIMSKIHMGPPPLIWMTDRQTWVKTLPSRTTWRAVKIHHVITHWYIEANYLIVKQCNCICLFG